MPQQYYQPFSQVGPFAPSRFFYVRSAMDPDALLRTIPRVVAGVDPDLPVDGLRTVEAQFATNVYVDRLVSALSASFAILATLLAAIGLYGMLKLRRDAAHARARRATRARRRPARLRAMVLKQVGVMAVIGCGIGIAGGNRARQNRRSDAVRRFGLRPTRRSPQLSPCCASSCWPPATFPRAARRASRRWRRCVTNMYESFVV